MEHQALADQSRGFTTRSEPLRLSNDNSRAHRASNGHLPRCCCDDLTVRLRSERSRVTPRRECFRSCIRRQEGELDPACRPLRRHRSSASRRPSNVAGDARIFRFDIGSLSSSTFRERRLRKDRAARSREGACGVSHRPAARAVSPLRHRPATRLVPRAASAMRRSTSRSAASYFAREGGGSLLLNGGSALSASSIDSTHASTSFSSSSARRSATDRRPLILHQRSACRFARSASPIVLSSACRCSSLSRFLLSPKSFVSDSVYPYIVSSSQTIYG